MLLSIYFIFYHNGAVIIYKGRIRILLSIAKKTQEKAKRGLLCFDMNVASCLFISITELLE